MASQSSKNVVFAFEAQAGLGTLASGAGAHQMLVRPSQGMQRAIALAQSQLVTHDGMMRKPRHGSTSVPASYETEPVVGDPIVAIIEAGLRGTEVAEATVTESAFTSLTISDSGATITAAAGSLISEGLGKGMMFKLAGMSTSANNGVWCPVLDLSANGRVVTTEPGLLTDQGADNDCDLIIARHVYNGIPPVERYFTVQQHMLDIDRSLVGQDMKVGTMRFSVAPDSPFSMGFDMLGRDLDILASVSSPTFTDPTLVEGPSLYLADGGAYIAGTRFANITGLEITHALGLSTMPVAGSRLSPDVFADNAGIGGTITMSIEDDTFLNYAQAETQVSLILHLAERETGTKDFITLSILNLSFGSFGLPFGGTSGMTQTYPLVGGKDIGGAAAGNIPCNMLVSTSAT